MRGCECPGVGAEGDSKDSRRGSRELPTTRPNRRPAEHQTIGYIPNWQTVEERAEGDQMRPHVSRVRAEIGCHYFNCGPENVASSLDWIMSKESFGGWLRVSR